MRGPAIDARSGGIPNVLAVDDVVVMVYQSFAIEAFVHRVALPEKLKDSFQILPFLHIR